jgi:hypothetical protein
MQLMKILFQSVVFGLVLLVASQPLLADTACTRQRCGGAPDCYMHLGSMAFADSAMQSLLASFPATPYVVFAESDCSYGSCWLRSDSATLLMATPQIFNLAGKTTLLMPVAQLSASRAAILAPRPFEDPASVAVPEEDGLGDAAAGGADRLFSPPPCSRRCIAFSNSFW